MQLSLITPISYLKYTNLLPGRFCVAPIALQQPDYLRYFSVASAQGYKVVLDNGIFEDAQVSVEDYIELARRIKPRVLIAPDTINADACANYKASDEFVAQWHTEKEDLDYAPELMHVIQCRKDDDEDFWHVLKTILDDPAYQWIGICRDAVYNAFSQYTQTEDQELNRFFFACRLQEMIPNNQELRKKKWHFLGMGSRLNLLPYYWFVDAMDTASLFYQATLGNVVTDEFILPGNLKRPPDYFIAQFLHEEEWVHLLQHNCNSALGMAQLADKNRRKILGGRL